MPGCSATAKALACAKRLVLNHEGINSSGSVGQSYPTSARFRVFMRMHLLNSGTVRRPEQWAGRGCSRRRTQAREPSAESSRADCWAGVKAGTLRLREGAGDLLIGRAPRSYQGGCGSV